MTERMVVISRGETLVLQCDLEVQRVEHGYGSIPVIDVGDKYKDAWLGEILQDELDGGEDDGDSIRYGKCLIVIQKLGGEDD